MDKNHLKTKIAIGTAQLGLNYGIANKSGKISQNEMGEILKFAARNGIDTIDTASSYGSSEKILGRLNVNNFKIITKLPVKVSKSYKQKWVFKSINSSIKKLKVEKLYGILIHNMEQLKGNFGKKIYEELLEAKKQKLVKKIGISIYSIDELKTVLNKYKFDIVSVPFNIFDQRIKKSGWLHKLKKLKIDIHARSSFLQGLLLMDNKERPKVFQKWNKLFVKWDKIVNKSNKSRMEICLGFVLSNPEIKKIVLGFDGYKQFKELTTKINNIKNPEAKLILSNDIKLINPTNWKSL